MSVSTTSMPGGTAPGDGIMSAGGPAPAVAGGRAAPSWAWSALLVIAAVWLALCWVVLRVEPSDMFRWAGAAVLFGAVSEAVRAIAGGRMWWLNVGMATLFAATGTVIMMDRGGSLTTPAALVGWYLLVRGAVDIVTATVSRAGDRTWGLPAAIGVFEVALGFWASSSFARTADMLVLMVGALALARCVADLLTSLSLRSALSSTGAATAPRTAQTAGARGYVAGMADFAAASAAGARPGRARHRAAGAAIMSAAAALRPERSAALRDGDGPVAAEQAADLDAMLALAGVSGAAVGSTTQAGGRPGTGGGAGASNGTSAGASAQGIGPIASFTPAGAPEPARPATMFTAPDVLPGGDAAATGDRRIPAGPPTGMSIGDRPETAAVQGTQKDTVRISPAAAAGTSANAAAGDRGGAPRAADRVGDQRPDRAADEDRGAGQGPGRPAEHGPDRGPDRPLGRRRAI